MFEISKVPGEQKNYRIKLTYLVMPLAMSARTVPGIIIFRD